MDMLVKNKNKAKMNISLDDASMPLQQMHSQTEKITGQNRFDARDTCTRTCTCCIFYITKSRTSIFIFQSINVQAPENNRALNMPGALRRYMMRRWSYTVSTQHTQLQNNRKFELDLRCD